jgi:isopropylmalate/homocitrate/citramalate synthase
MITGGFFLKYYVKGTMRLRESEEKDQVRMTLEDAESLIESLFLTIKDIYELNSPVLSDAHKDMIAQTCYQLSRSVELKELRFKNPREIAAAAAESVKANGVQILNGKAMITTEAKTLERYEQYLAMFEKDESVQNSAHAESMGFIRSIQALPFIKGLFRQPFLLL